jgi:hypothetical protein
VGFIGTTLACVAVMCLYCVRVRDQREAELERRGEELRRLSVADPLTGA